MTTSSRIFIYADFIRVYKICTQVGDFDLPTRQPTSMFIPTVYIEAPNSDTLYILVIQCMHFLPCLGHQSLTSGMQLRKNILVSGNADSNVKVCMYTDCMCIHHWTSSHALII